LSIDALGMRAERDAGGIRIHHHGTFRFDLLVALETLLGVVAGLALFDDDLDAADAAITLVEHVEVVGHAVGDRRARARESAGAVGQERNIKSIRGVRCRDRERASHDRRKCGPKKQLLHSHHIPPSVSG